MIYLNVNKYIINLFNHIISNARDKISTLSFNNIVEEKLLKKSRRVNSD